MELKESIIPKSVWNFVKGVINNPMQAGILAMIISSFLKKHGSESFSTSDIFIEQIFKEPNWVQDESKWKKAKTAFRKQYNHEPKKDEDWAIVTGIYQNMGGKIASEILNNIRGESKMEKVKERINNLYEKVVCKEGVMGDYIMKADEYIKKYPNMNTAQLEDKVFKDLGQHSLTAAGICDMIRRKKKESLSEHLNKDDIIEVAGKKMQVVEVKDNGY
jgi:hypothetical protein